MSRLNLTAICLSLALWVLILIGISKSDFASSADVRIENYDTMLVVKIAIKLNNQVSASVNMRIHSNLSNDQLTSYHLYFDDYPVLMALPKWVSSHWVNLPAALKSISTAIFETDDINDKQVTG